MGIATRRKGLRADEDDFKAAAELIEQSSVVAFLLIKGLEETGRPLKDFTSSGKLRRRKQSGNHATLGGEADAEPLRQRRRRRAIARDGRAAKGNPERIVQPILVQAENLAARGGGREWPQR